MSNAFKFVSVYFFIQVHKKFGQGQSKSANKASRKAKYLSIAAMIIGMLMFIVIGAAVWNYEAHINDGVVDSDHPFNGIIDDDQKKTPRVLINIIRKRTNIIVGIINQKTTKRLFYKPEFTLFEAHKDDGVADSDHPFGGIIDDDYRKKNFFSCFIYNS